MLGLPSVAINGRAVDAATSPHLLIRVRIDSRESRIGRAIIFEHHTQGFRRHEDLDAIKKVLDAFIARAHIESAMKRTGDRKVG